MVLRFLLIISILLISCSKDKVEYKPKSKESALVIYQDAYEAFEKSDFFMLIKFLDAEISSEVVEFSAKASIMASYCLYSINFYEEALDNLERFLKQYPKNANSIYAHYLISVIYYEQIKDEKKDMEPLLKANKKIDYFLKEFPNTDYAIDLKFKKDLIINQMAAKELYVAKYYISVKKWIPAINRLKIILQKYDQTIFAEEALHRLVEINYFIGLEEEAKKYAKILGYNYNSSEWYKQSYKVLNRDYVFLKKEKEKKKNNLLKRIIEKIK